MLEQTLADLCRGAEDLDPILHSFKNAQHLRVGVRDILGKDDVRSTHAALADIAEACLQADRRAASTRSWSRSSASRRFSIPSESEPPTAGALQQWQRFADREGDACEPVVLALGKLGGREPNYHSDLDLIFLYEADGNTLGRQRGSHGSTTNRHFFSELGQRVILMMSHLGPHGRLYEVDARLRPTGKSGLLAVPLAAFARYFSEGRGQLWERQALCKARVVLGSPAAAEYAMQAVADAAFGPPWQPEYRDRDPRRCGCGWKRPPRRATSSAAPAARSTSSSSCRCCSSSTAAPIRRSARPARSTRSTRFEAGGYLSSDDADYFRRSYRFQRSIEARIRLMNAAGRHELPDNPEGAGQAGVSAGLRGLERAGRRGGAHVRREPRAVQSASSTRPSATKSPSGSAPAATCGVSYPAMSITASYDSAGSTKILPSPMRPVRAISTILRVTSSARVSSTQSVISTLGRNVCEYSESA